MYAITGVTGHTGSVAATTLLAQGKKVRVIVRDAAKGDAWKAKGAEVAVADVSDEAALTRAFAGVAGVYILLPPEMTSPDPLASNAARTKAIVAAAVAAKVPHVVLLSSVGAHLPHGTGPILALGRAEQAFLAAGVPLTAVRASFFQENWQFSFGMIDQGSLPTFLPPTMSYPQVASADIGRTVAGALVEGARGSTRVIELAGPREYSADDAAKSVSEITGKTVAALHAPLEAVVATFTGMGTSQRVAELYLEMYTGLASGTLVAQGPIVRGTTELAETLRAALGR